MAFDSQTCTSGAKSSRILKAEDVHHEGYNTSEEAESNSQGRQLAESELPLSDVESALKDLFVHINETLQQADNYQHSDMLSHAEKLV